MSADTIDTINSASTSPQTCPPASTAAGRRGGSAAGGFPADAAPTQNLNVLRTQPLVSPQELARQLPVTPESHVAVVEGRRTIEAILRGADDRLLVVIGPCSIHHVEAAMDYARRLAELKRRYADRLYVIMRVYFEKPRTTVGWKGLINDPHLDDSFDIGQGIRLARKLLLDVTALGVPAATEMLDPITPQYIDDLVSWAAIGARTTESQTHRQMASGLSMPVGYKNSTTGNLKTALDAMKSARHPHHFLGIDEQGRTCIVQTRGNAQGHLILRGGAGRTNFDPDHVAQAAQMLRDANLPPAVMVDCSHANSGKKQKRQEAVWHNLLDQRTAASAKPSNPAAPSTSANPSADGQRSHTLIGAMIESNLMEGNQKIGDDPAALRYGVSITDECIGWDKTAQMLDEAYDRLGG